jgi:hypothetical protein
MPMNSVTLTGPPRRSMQACRKETRFLDATNERGDRDLDSGVV